MDIFAEFEIELLASEGVEKDVGCGGGAHERSALGPFGILAIADDQLSELTPIYFRLSSTAIGTSTTFFCVDETRYQIFILEDLNFIKFILVKSKSEVNLFLKVCLQRILMKILTIVLLIG